MRGGGEKGPPPNAPPPQKTFFIGLENFGQFGGGFFFSFSPFPKNFQFKNFFKIFFGKRKIVLGELFPPVKFWGGFVLKKIGVPRGVGKCKRKKKEKAFLEKKKKGLWVKKKAPGKKNGGGKGFLEKF